MYYNQSFDEKPEDMLLHGKLKNDGGHTNTTRMHLPKDAEKTALRLVRIMLKRLRASGRPMPVKYTMPPFFEFEGGRYEMKYERKNFLVKGREWRSKLSIILAKKIEKDNQNSLT